MGCDSVAVRMAQSDQIECADVSVLHDVMVRATSRGLMRPCSGSQQMSSARLQYVWHYFFGGSKKLVAEVEAPRALNVLAHAVEQRLGCQLLLGSLRGQVATERRPQLGELGARPP